MMLQWIFIDVSKQREIGKRMTNFLRCDFQVDSNGREGCFEELRWMVDCITVKDHKLHGPGQFEDALDFCLHLAYKNGE